MLLKNFGERSWLRDKSISKFCEQYNILWQESQQNGVVRGLKNRANWAKLWNDFMGKPQINNSYSRTKEINIEHPFVIPEKLKKKLNHYPKSYQPAGENMGWRYLSSFLEDRGVNYQKHISKPTWCPQKPRF